MKNLILSVITLLILSSVCLYAGERVKILFKKGGQIEGTFIDSVSGASIKIKPDDFPVTVYEMSDISQIVNLRTYYNKMGIFGFGLGVQYGVLGAGVELHIPSGYGSVFGGIGTTVFAGMGYGIGARAYFRNFDASFQPRVTLLFGTNSVLIIQKTDFFGSSTKNDYEVGTGVDICAGFKWMFGSTHSWDIDADIFYVASSTLYERIDELKNDGVMVNDDLPPIDFAFGFVFSF